VKDFVLPDSTLTESAILRLGSEIRLLHFTGHTRGDVVVYMPAERVLITGDLLDDLPYTGHGSPRALVETMRALDKLEFDVIIPGHGGVRRGADAREHLRKVAELFDSIVKQAEAAVREGLSADDAKKKVDVSTLRAHFVTDDASGRYWNFFVGEAVARAHGEATEKK
jgi:cyclase